MFHPNILIDNTELAGKSPMEILSWTWSRFKPDVVATSSFQTQSVPLLHMISQTVPELPVLFIDTGYHFPETLSFRDQLAKILTLNLRIIRPAENHVNESVTDAELYRSDPDACCHRNKVQPLQKAMRGFRVWISGIRQDQTGFRRNANVTSMHHNGMLVIAPIVSWTEQDVKQYIVRHNLPSHPLSRFGYTSIGCAPCTKQLAVMHNRRAGRWAGLKKTECGIHLDLKPSPLQTAP